MTSSKTTLVMNGLLRPFVEPHLPANIEAKYFMSTEEMIALAPEADIGWFDHEKHEPMLEAIRAATKMKWLNSIYAGLDFLPFDLVRERGFVITNGAGINAITISEYVVMMMLTFAKGYRDVVRAQDRNEWLLDSPGKRELTESKVLILGYGAIGKAVEQRLVGFGMEVTKVRRSAGEGTLGPDEWRSRLGEFDWVILAVPATAETDAMIGADELAAMKTNAVLVNVARGAVVDQAALVSALEERSIAGALLDVTDPEPLPEDHPLWGLENAHVTMHLSGRAQEKMFMRSAERFMRNLTAYANGEPIAPIFDPERGY